jgi:hypothetical protein
MRTALTPNLDAREPHSHPPRAVDRLLKAAAFPAALAIAGAATIGIHRQWLPTMTLQMMAMLGSVCVRARP